MPTPTLSQHVALQLGKLAAVTALVLGACGFVPFALAQAQAQAQDQSSPAKTSPTDPKDPFESFNRTMFEFNDSLDTHITKPVSEAYVRVTPSLVQTGVRNFFGNLSDIWSTVNNALQLKPASTVESLARVSVNTILGLGGVIDWASKMDLAKHSEDFGQTLGYWGVGSGPYLVLPLLGPSTLRDTVALDLDLRSNPITRVRPEQDRYELMVLNLVDKRAKYLELGDQLNEVALDRYSFVRDVFLQKRRSEVFDGDPPDEDDSSADPSP